MDRKHVSEQVNSTFGSVVFKYLFQESFSPVIKEWKRQITQDLSLSDIDRRGIIIAYNELYKGFLSMYENSKIDPPEWFFKEFDRENG